MTDSPFLVKDTGVDVQGRQYNDICGAQEMTDYTANEEQNHFLMEDRAPRVAVDGSLNDGDQVVMSGDYHRKNEPKVTDCHQRYHVNSSMRRDRNSVDSGKSSCGSIMNGVIEQYYIDKTAAETNRAVANSLHRYSRSEEAFSPRGFAPIPHGKFRRKNRNSKLTGKGARLVPSRSWTGMRHNAGPRRINERPGMLPSPPDHGRIFPDTDDAVDVAECRGNQRSVAYPIEVANPPHTNASFAPFSSGLLLPMAYPTICDRVTVDIALFMHLVDSYALSGDSMKRMRLCSLMQFMIAGFRPSQQRDCEINDDSQVLRCIPFGSFTYNLHLPWASDLDFVLLPASDHYAKLLSPGATIMSRTESTGQVDGEQSSPVLNNEDSNMDHVKTAEQCTTLLGEISDYLGKNLPSGTITSKPTVISSSRIPLITVTCREFIMDSFDRQWCSSCSLGPESLCPMHAPVQLQISLSGPRHTGLETSAYIALMSQHFECLRPLVLIVKHVLLCDGLVSTYNGGVSSYTLVLMVVSFLNQFYSGDSWLGVPLGQLLLGFLSWYGGVDNNNDDEVSGNGEEDILFHQRDRVSLVFPDGSTFTTFDASRLIIRPLSTSGDSVNFELRSSDDPSIDLFKMDMLVILDPLSPLGETLNLGRSAWRWPSVTAALRSARKSLLTGSWWGQKYGISIPTVWVAAKRAGHGSSATEPPVSADSSGSATGTTRSSVEGGGATLAGGNGSDDDITMKSAQSFTEVHDIDDAMKN